MTNKAASYLYQFSAITVLLSALFFLQLGKFAPFLLGFGALGVTIGTILGRYKGKSTRAKRLTNIQVIGGLFMLAGAIFLYFKLNYWVMCLLIGAILTLYTTFMLERTLRSEAQDDDA